MCKQLRKIIMKFKTLTIVPFFLLATMAFAQDAPKLPVDISGVIFGSYYVNLSDADARLNTPNKGKHGYDLERVWLNFQKSLGDNWSMRVTTDIVQVTNTSGNPDNPAPRGVPFIRWAAVEYKDNFGDIGARAQFGIMDHPIDGLLNRLAGMRWLSRTQLDLNGMQNSADLGALVEFNFFKLATLNLSLLNGEGFGTIRQANEPYSGKEFNGLLSITPIEQLYINLFYTYEKFDKGSADSFFGGGIAWSDKLYKAGVNVTLTDDDVKRAQNANALFVDGWVNVGFKDLIGLPFTLNGRVGYIARDDDTVGDTTTFAVGPGYQFNSNVQFALWGTYSKTGDTDADMAVSLKTEIRF